MAEIAARIQAYGLVDPLATDRRRTLVADGEANRLPLSVSIVDPGDERDVSEHGAVELWLDHYTHWTINGIVQLSAGRGCRRDLLLDCSVKKFILDDTRIESCNIGARSHGDLVLEHQNVGALISNRFLQFGIHFCTLLGIKLSRRGHRLFGNVGNQPALAPCSHAHIGGLGIIIIMAEPIHIGVRIEIIW
jgi:hypothetical protein